MKYRIANALYNEFVNHPVRFAVLDALFWFVPGVVVGYALRAFS